LVPPSRSAFGIPAHAERSRAFDLWPERGRESVCDLDSKFADKMGGPEAVKKFAR